jgi:hypothetical protein
MAGTLGWMGLAAGGVLAAQSPTPQLPSFRSGIDVVRLDASVLDKDRRPGEGSDRRGFHDHGRRHLLTIEATVDAAMARRDVRFSVR